MILKKIEVWNKKMKFQINKNKIEGQIEIKKEKLRQLDTDSYFW